MASWKRLADLSIKTGGLTLSCIDGKVYAIGGTTGTTDLTMTECYDKTSNTWISKADAPGIINSHSATVVGKEIYTLGGSGGTNNKVYAYNTASNIWRLVTTTPYSCFWSGAVSYNGYIYLIGGMYDGFTYNNLYRLDLTTNTWTKLASIPEPRDSFGYCVTPDGNIYVIGGKQDTLSQTTSDSIYRYNIAKDTWTLLDTKLPVVMSKTRAVYSFGKIYIAGGENRTGSGYLRNFCEYDIETNTITELPLIPTGTYAHGLCVDENDNTLYFAGGFAGGFYVPTVYSYQLNPLPEITIDTENAGSLPSPLIKTYTVNDDSNLFDIIEKVNDTVIRTLTNQTNGEFTIDLTSKWDGLSYGKNTVTITAIDKLGASKSKTLAFKKVLSDLPLDADLITTTNVIKNIGNQLESISNEFREKLTQFGVVVPPDYGIQDMISLIQKQKRVLKGTISTPTGYDLFTYAGSKTTSNSYYIELPKFNFEPRLILLETMSTDGINYYTSIFNKEEGSVNYNTISCSYHTRTYNSSTNSHWAIDNFVDTNNVYKIPVIASNMPYNWIAYE